MIRQWDDFTVDFNARRLSGSEGSIHVEPQVFDVLEYLIRHHDRVVSKAELLDEVWGDQFVSESALTTRIKQARRALGDDGRKQRFIRNVHGRGYQFVGDLLQDSAAAGGRSPAAPTVEVNPAVAIGVDDEFRFVGRLAELETAQAALTAGRERAVRIHIAGPAGSGKSRLGVEILRQASADGAIVAAGRCEPAMISGLQPLRDAMAQLARHYPRPMVEWARGLEPGLVSLIPSLVDTLTVEPVPVDSYAGIDLLIAAFDRMADQAPLVIMVDDYQWSDELTAVLVDRVARRLSTQPITIVTTERTGEGAPTEDRHGDRTTGSARPGDRFDVVLGPLTDDAVRDLVGSVVAEDPDGDSSESASDHVDGFSESIEANVEQLLLLTNGDCLFLTESLRDIQQGQRPSDSVVELIKARLDRQPAETRQMIVSGAILGPEFSFDVAVRMAGLDPVAGLDAVSQAIAVELIHETESPARFRFSHQLVPDAILNGLSRSRRCQMELACADALTEMGADDVEIALHLIEAVPLVAVETVVEASWSAALEARRAKQFDRAIRLLDRTLGVDPPARQRAELRLMMGELFVDRGTPGEALDRLDQVVDAARHNQWPDLLIDAALAYWGQSPFRKPRDMTTLELLAEADSLVGSEPSTRKARVLAKTAVFNVFRQPLAVRDRMTAEALDMIDGLDPSPDQRLELLEARAITFTCPAGVDELDVLDPQIAALRYELNAYFADAATPESRLFMKGFGPEFRTATEGDASRIAAQPIAEWRDYVLRSTLAAFDGNIDAARDLSDKAAEIGEAFWGESAFALHGFSHFALDLVSDEWSRSQQLLELLVAFDGSPIFLAPLALAKLEAGDRDGSLSTLDQLDPALVERFDEHILGGSAMVGCAELALRLDDDDLSEVSRRALEPYAHLIMGVPWAAFSLAAADPLSRLARRRGDDEAAIRLAGQARDLYRSLDAPHLLNRLEQQLHG